MACFFLDHHWIFLQRIDFVPTKSFFPPNSIASNFKGEKNERKNYDCQHSFHQLTKIKTFFSLIFFLFFTLVTSVNSPTQACYICFYFHFSHRFSTYKMKRFFFHFFFIFFSNKSEIISILHVILLVLFAFEPWWSYAIILNWNLLSSRTIR